MIQLLSLPKLKAFRPCKCGKDTEISEDLIFSFLLSDNICWFLCFFYSICEFFSHRNGICFISFSWHTFNCQAWFDQLVIEYTNFSIDASAKTCMPCPVVKSNTGLPLIFSFTGESPSKRVLISPSIYSEAECEPKT